MSDRSDEVTESRDTDDLLEETERLLSESGSGVDAREPADAGTTPESNGRPDAPRAPSLADGTATAESSAETTGSSRRSRLTSWLSVEKLFSPKAFFAFVLLLGTGLLAGDTVLPLAGRMIGMFGVAFTIGLVTSRRRYLEMAAAGTSVGAVSAVVSNAFLAAAGSFQTVVAVGVAVGLVACLGGYYFGRDLRDGLARDIE